MGIGMWFWLFFVLSVLGYGFGIWRPEIAWSRGWPVLLVICLGILGWAVFGGPVK